ncbi:MAG: glutamine--fructose-6-phosphate transaminase (isomerizing) [Clostridiales bacterium]|jgi:glucosamine--fructose-6-phosphate aminotransferase (isomerizing)|nr:glutamine--fructose-6-phosphate transaminase (isomerizing) [Clostridiales bacterium]
MCGIVGYIGSSAAVPILVDGLKRLEYRGYDSAGVTIIENGALKTVKCKGRISVLEQKLAGLELLGMIHSGIVDADSGDTSPVVSVGIGHTRWATHGEPSDKNSHPHTSASGRISVVHNGIIENYQEIRRYLKNKGYDFYTETDTEVIPNLIDYYYRGNLEEAVTRAVSRMTGGYALGIIAMNEPDKIVAVRKDSPLIVGVANNGGFIASDVSALLPYTREVYYLDDNELAIMSREDGKVNISFATSDGEPIEKEINRVTWSVAAAEKGGFEHFMLKEIHEQPSAIKDTMTGRVGAGEPVVIDGLNLSENDIKNIEKIFIVACGTAYHAGLVGKSVIEKMTGIPIETDIASEFRYRDPIIPKNTLMIVISQSGETLDTLVALREAKKKGAATLAIANVVGSTITRECDSVIYTWAGPEIAVASTKAYTTQLVALVTIGLYFAQARGTIPSEEAEYIKSEMIKLPEKAQTLLEMKDTLQKFASRTYNHHDMFYLGRGLDYALAMEGALKLKEISYIHTESYAGGELKHGTIALIEDGSVVIAMATQEYLREKMISNIVEVTSRGANVLGFTMKGKDGVSDSRVPGVAREVFEIPWTHSCLAPILAIIPLQLFAYYIAVLRGCDVDKPRNLAKSVTVE